MMFTVALSLAVANAQSKPDVIPCPKYVVKDDNGTEVAKVSESKGWRRVIYCNVPREEKNQAGDLEPKKPTKVWAKTYSKLQCNKDGWAPNARQMGSTAEDRMRKVCKYWQEKVMTRCPRKEVEGVAKMYRFHRGHSVGAVLCKLPSMPNGSETWSQSSTTLKCGQNGWNKLEPTIEEELKKACQATATTCPEHTGTVTLERTEHGVWKTPTCGANQLPVVADPAALQAVRCCAGAWKLTNDECGVDSKDVTDEHWAAMETTCTVVDPAVKEDTTQEDLSVELQGGANLAEKIPAADNSSSSTNQDEEVSVETTTTVASVPAAKQQKTENAVPSVEQTDYDL